MRPALATSRDCARANFTHVALICDDTAIQPLLPQLIIVGERVARARDMPTLRASLPANAYLMRLKRGWTNCMVHQMVLALLRDALAHIRDEYEVILSMDACKVHLSGDCVAALVESNVHLVIIPAKTTWLLQPLDTHVFALYKRFLRNATADERPRLTDMHELTRFMLAKCGEAIRLVLQAHPWRRSFEENGFSTRQQSLRAFVRDTLGDPLVQSGSERPTLEEVQQLWPRDLKLSRDTYTHLFHGFHTPIAESDGPAPAASASATGTPRRRLKRKTSIDLEEAQH